MRFDRERHRIAVIADRALARDRPLETIVRAAIAGGAELIQLRDKEADSRGLHDTALALREITRRHGTLFLVNDRADIAAAAGADGVHLGQRDLPLEAARRLLGPHAVIGISAESAEEAAAAQAGGADYLGVGPVFEARATKPDAGPPAGPDLVRRIRAHCSLPILAIGGIGPHNAAAAIAAGADGVAVISSVVAAPDVAHATRSLREAVLAALAARVRRA
jgi:thiamine-phosphate diphosphorylase